MRTAFFALVLPGAAACSVAQGWPWLLGADPFRNEQAICVLTANPGSLWEAGCRLHCRLCALTGCPVVLSLWLQTGNYRHRGVIFRVSIYVSKVGCGKATHEEVTVLVLHLMRRSKVELGP